MIRSHLEPTGRGHIVSENTGYCYKDANINTAFMNQRDLINFRLGKSSRYSPGIFVDDFEPFQASSIVSIPIMWLTLNLGYFDLFQ